MMMSGYPPPQKPAPAEPAAEAPQPQTLFVIVPSSPAAESTPEKSAQPSIPACSPAPGNN